MSRSPDSRKDQSVNLLDNALTRLSIAAARAKKRVQRGFLDGAVFVSNSEPWHVLHWMVLCHIVDPELCFPKLVATMIYHIRYHCRPIVQEA